MLSAHLIKLILILGDIGVFYLSVVLALTLRHLEIPDSNMLSEHLKLFTPLIMAWIGVFYFSGLYSRQIILFLRKSFELLVLSQFINVALIAVPFFFIIPGGINPKAVLVLYLFVSLVILFLWRIFIFPNLFLNYKIKFYLLSPTKVKGYTNLGINRGDLLFNMQIHSLDYKDIKSDCLKYKDSTLIVNDNLNLRKLPAQFLNCTIINKINIISRNMFDELFGVYNIDCDNILDIYFSLHRNSLRSSVFNLLKRIFDFLLAVLILPVVLFISLIAAVAIYLNTGMPIIYKSKRRGLNGKDFYLYKFRTMNGSDSGKEALKSKLKVTRVGKFLRKTRLDELPQIINILKGDMSFIGPRPEISELADKYENKIPCYFLRNLAKPGLSGWAQIHHRNPPHHKIDIKATKEKLQYDLFYIMNQSLLLDLQIAIQTIITLVGLRGR